MASGTKKHRSLLNINSIVISFLAAVIFLLLFVAGFFYEISGSVFGIDPGNFDGILEFGLNNGLTFSLVCGCILYILVRLYTLDILISYDGANILLKTSIWIFTVWIVNLFVYIFTDYFNLHIFIAILALIVFFFSLLVRYLAEKYAQFVATHHTEDNFADINVPVFFSFVEFLFKKEQPPMPDME